MVYLAELILSTRAYEAAGTHRWPRVHRQTEPDVVGGRRVDTCRVIGCSQWAESTHALGHSPPHEPIYAQMYPKLARNAVKFSHPVVDAEERCSFSTQIFTCRQNQHRVQTQTRSVHAVVNGSEKSTLGLLPTTSASLKLSCNLEGFKMLSLFFPSELFLSTNVPQRSYQQPNAMAEGVLSWTSLFFLCPHVFHIWLRSKCAPSLR